MTIAAASGTLLTDPVPAVLGLTVRIGFVVAAMLAATWVKRFVARERMLRTLTAQFPQEASRLRTAVRRQPLLFERRPTGPADPCARTHHVVVTPYGDGRPGESFWAPGPGVFNDDGPASDNSRQDVRVALAPGVHLIVVSLGRIGPTEAERSPALERAQRVRDRRQPGMTLFGPVDRVDSAMGLGWRTTTVYASGAAVTDTQVDRDGWAFVVGVRSAAHSTHASSVEALEHVLASWTWIPAGPTVG